MKIKNRNEKHRKKISRNEKIYVNSKTVKESNEIAE